MPKWLCPLSVIAASALVGCGGRGSGDAPQTPGAIGPRRIVALGRIEPAGGIISISALPGERLKSFADGVQEGAIVDAGAELARVGTFDLRNTQLEAAEAKLRLAREQRQYEIAAANAQLEQAIAAQAQAEAKREEVASQQLKLQNLAEAAAIAEDDYQSLASLHASDDELVTDRQLRRQRNLSDRATKEHAAAAASFNPALTAAEKAVEAAKANVKLARHHRELLEKVDQSVAAEMERKIAQESLDQSVLRAPKVEGGSTKFTVLKIMLQPGEFVAQIPILEIGDLSHMVCVAEVYEADAKEIVPGQSATIRSPAFAGRFADGDLSGTGGIAGKVVRVGTLIGSPGLTNRNPLAPSDRSVVEVLVEIDPADKEATAEAAKRVGLQVTVEFGDKPASEPTEPQPAEAPEADAP